MEKILNIGGKNYCMGLEWLRITSSADPEVQAKSFARARSVKYGVLRQIVNDGASPINQVGLCSLKVKGKVFTAGGAISTQYPSSVVIAQINPDLYWMCICSEGRVVPGMDVLGSDSEIKSIFSSFAQENDLTYMSVIYASKVGSDLELHGNFINKDPLQILSESTPGDDLLLTNVRGVTPKFYLGVGIVFAGTSLFGLLAYNDHQRELAYKSEQEALLLEQQAQALQEKLMAGPTDEELLLKAREQEIQWLKEDLNKGSAEEVIRWATELATRLPINASGWYLGKITYDHTQPHKASSVWIRDRGTAADFKASFKDVDVASVSAKLDVGVVTSTLPNTKRNIEDPISFLKNSGEKAINFSDELIRGNIKFSVAPVTGEQRREQIAGLKNKQNSSEPQLSLMKKEYDLNGSEKPGLYKVYKVISKFQNLYIESVEVELSDGGFNWKIKAKIIEI